LALCDAFVRCFVDPASDFEGGDFCCANGDGSSVNPTFEKAGDAILFCSHKTHTVLPVVAGKRQVCIIEFWQGEERSCGHRCNLHWGKCPLLP
jgi:predicted 2-oxoglutarate/Fe(II)-dependent dioxygenase YbiX